MFNLLEKKIFWDYQNLLSIKDIPLSIRSQRYVDFWPVIHNAYKKNELNIEDIKAIVKDIYQNGPTNYCENIREFVIKNLIKRWF